MAKKFKSFADRLDKAKTVSDFEFEAFCEKMKIVARVARRNRARAIQSAKEVFIGR